MLSGFGFDGAYRLAAFVVRLAQRLAVPRRTIVPIVRLFGCFLKPAACLPGSSL